MAMAEFQNTLSKIVVLTLFVPLCISTGGNSGSQAATLITRALALGQVTEREWWRVLRHELLMGLVLGATLGVLGFLLAFLIPSSLMLDTETNELVPNWRLALVVSQAVVGICLWGTLVGSMLPLFLRKVGIDPGIASNPFVATLVDVTGIIIYFSIASIYLF
jgi:magnesium transporter